MAAQHIGEYVSKDMAFFDEAGDSTYSSVADRSVNNPGGSRTQKLNGKERQTLTIAVDRSNYVGLAHRIVCWRKRLARPVDISCCDVPDLPNGACLFAGFPFLIMPIICIKRLFSFCGKTPNL